MFWYFNTTIFRGSSASGGLPEDGREKIPKHVKVLYLQTRFYILLVLNVEVNVF
jgi:hypothetical protein